MLTNSYIHIPYVGSITEKKIWDSGITSWKSFDCDKLNLSEFRRQHIKKFVDLSIEAFEKKNYRFFSSLLSQHEHWRCIPDMYKIAYLDIETTGLDKENDDITLIGVYDGDDSALELLKKYNQEDIIGLKILAQQVYFMFRKYLFEHS